MRMNGGSRPTAELRVAYEPVANLCHATKLAATSRTSAGVARPFRVGRY
jgi:hypothetical protein